MRSSEHRRHGRAALAAVCASALVACGVPPMGAPTTAAVQCSPAGEGLPPARFAELGALRRSVETGPLYSAVAAGRAPHCTVSAEGSQWQIDYRFAAAAALRVTRDVSIEYTDYAATVTWPAGPDAQALLARAEHAAFSPAGCGIDWKRPETRATDAVPPGRQRIWRGSACNCQARVVEDSAGRVLAFGLRSAC